MKFSRNQEVTPAVPGTMNIQFGKIYQVRTYDRDFICACGAPTVQLKEFPETFVFCENWLDPVGTRDKIQADLSSLGNLQIEHVKKKEMTKPWYPKKSDPTIFLPKTPPPPKKEPVKKGLKLGRPFVKHPVNECPRCEGSGKVHDLKTNIERPCSCCSGTGKLK